MTSRGNPNWAGSDSTKRYLGRGFAGQLDRCEPRRLLAEASRARLESADRPREGIQIRISSVAPRVSETATWPKSRLSSCPAMLCS